MKDLMMLYGVTLGRRYSLKEKSLFKQEVKSRFEEKGYEVYFQPVKGSRGGSNIIIGDVSAAKVILAAAYDTPCKTLIPNSGYFPLHSDRNLNEGRNDLLFRSIVAVLLCVFAFLLFRYAQPFTDIIRVILTCFSALLVIGSLFIFKNSGGKFNFNRNSAALAVMASAADKLNKDIKNQTAFVYLDKQVSSFAGIKAFSEIKEAKEKTIVFLDCLAQGETMVLAHRKNCLKPAEDFLKAAASLDIIDKTYTEINSKQNVTGFFENILYLVSGKIESKELAVRNTHSGKDIALDISRLENIVLSTVKFIEES